MAVANAGASFTTEHRGLALREEALSPQTLTGQMTSMNEDLRRFRRYLEERDKELKAAETSFSSSSICSADQHLKDLRDLRAELLITEATAAAIIASGKSVQSQCLNMIKGLDDIRVKMLEEQRDYFRKNWAASQEPIEMALKPEFIQQGQPKSSELHMEVFSSEHAGDNIQEIQYRDEFLSEGFQGHMDGSSTALVPLSDPVIIDKHGAGSANNGKDHPYLEEGKADDKVNLGKLKLKGVGKKRRLTKPSSENENAKQSNGTTDSAYAQRLTGQKQNIIHDENGNKVDNFASPLRRTKKFRKGGSSCDPYYKDKAFSGDANEAKGQSRRGKLMVHDRQEGTNEKTSSKIKFSFDSNLELEPFSAPNFGIDSSLKLTPFTQSEPEFYDFASDKDTTQFAVNQIWAVYDIVDLMPRTYARIKQVYTGDFKLYITWLVYHPISEFEITWSNEKLPVSCGNFRIGESIVVQDCSIFSHNMSSAKQSKRNSYAIIFPQKGEVWALFKGWDIGWISDADNKSYKYEVVEILSEFKEGTEIRVISLVRVKGFSSVFIRAEGQETTFFTIPSEEVLRFSHRVPYRLTGDEREGIPKGSFELDPMALPSDYQETFPLINLDTMTEAPKHKGESTNFPPTYSCEYPDSEFHDFGEEKSSEKFRTGQIWALYSELDGYPKIYGCIKKAELEEFKVDVIWLDAQQETSWMKEDLPISCGMFKLSHDMTTYRSSDYFSHPVQPKVTEMEDQYRIFPGVGEVWAIYKNWNGSWRRADLNNCEYDVVEVLEQTSSGMRGSMLTKLDGYEVVFGPERNGVMLTIEIPVDEILRFSHQIPAFKLTDEAGGKLRGLWELDPASVPGIAKPTN